MSEKQAPVKILLVGHEAAGKTAFLVRYCDNTFSSTYNGTVGIDFRAKEITREGTQLSLQIWDTAGLDRYQSIVRAYYTGTRGFIIMHDVTAKDSLVDVKERFASIRELTGEETKVLLVGTKTDLADTRVVTKEQGSELAKELGIEYFEVSTKSGTNVKEAVDKLLDMIFGEQTENQKPEVEDITATKPSSDEEKPTKIEPSSEVKPTTEKKPSVEAVSEKPVVTELPHGDSNSCWNSTVIYVSIGGALVLVFCAWYFSKS